MSEPKDGDATFDPFEAWRGVRDASLDAWAKAMVDTVKSEAYAQTSGAMLDAFLTTSAPFREMLAKTMIQALEQLNMPTRADVTSLAERLTNIEMRLDDFDAKLDAALQGERAEPRRSRSSGKEPK